MGRCLVVHLNVEKIWGGLSVPAHFYGDHSKLLRLRSAVRTSILGPWCRRTCGAVSSSVDGIFKPAAPLELGVGRVLVAHQHRVEARERRHLDETHAVPLGQRSKVRRVPFVCARVSSGSG